MSNPRRTMVDVRRADPRPQRRLDHRFRTLGRAARIDALGASGLCRVIDLSDRGAGIETSIPLASGDPVRVSFDSENHVRGRVAWQTGKRAGVRFLEPVASFALIRKIASDHWNGVARPPRLQTRIAAIVHGQSGSFATIIDNISQDGLRVRHPRCLRVGNLVEAVTGRGLRIRGTVRWSDDLCAGVALSGRLTVEQLANARDL